MFTPDDLTDGRLPDGHVVVFDDDGFYWGSVTADLLHQHGCGVVHKAAGDTIRRSPRTTSRTRTSQAHGRVGIEALVLRNGAVFDGTRLTMEDVWTHRRHELKCDVLVLITARLPDDALYRELQQREAEWTATGIRMLRDIGGAETPGLIVLRGTGWKPPIRSVDLPQSGHSSMPG